MFVVGSRPVLGVVMLLYRAYPVIVLLVLALTIIMIRYL